MIAHATCIALWYPRPKWPHLCTLVHDTVPAFFATPKLLTLFREFDRCARPEECFRKGRIKETSCFRWPDYLTQRAFMITPADKSTGRKFVTSQYFAISTNSDLLKLTPDKQLRMLQVCQNSDGQCIPHIQQRSQVVTVSLLFTTSRL